jgi:hypothetical protein
MRWPLLVGLAVLPIVYGSASTDFLQDTVRTCIFSSLISPFERFASCGTFKVLPPHQLPNALRVAVAEWKFPGLYWLRDHPVPGDGKHETRG